MARVIVTAASSRYFPPLLTLLTTLRRSATRHDGVVIWDLGLRASERRVLRSLAGVEVMGLPSRARWPYSDWGEPAGIRRSYAFKPFACLRTGFPGDVVLWLDAGVAVMQDLEGVFERIEQDGLLLLDNPPYTNDRWTSPDCAEAMAATVSELAAPQVAANVVGLRLGGPWQRVFDDWLRFSTGRAAFVGPRSRHRHDQTVLSILASRYAVPVASQSKFARRTTEDALDAGVCFAAHRRRDSDVMLAPRGVFARVALPSLRVDHRVRDSFRAARGRLGGRRRGG
jgi:hypothetical protein